MLTETVLQDYGLAQKLLRLVNTVAFAQRGQVTTISRAVLLLGFERVRSVATGLILFEHLQAHARTPERNTRRRSPRSPGQRVRPRPG